MNLRLMNVVVLAEDYDALRDWYVEALDLEILAEWTEHYHYAELAREGRLVAGIASAREMGVAPGDRKGDATVGQIVTDDLKGLFARIRGAGGETPFGPSFDEHGNFWFGGFTDPEGNAWWAVEMPDHLD